MEVTKDNFDELLPSILEAIQQCTFLAIDAELTGLHLTDDKENYFDSVEERYRFIRQSATNFLLVQFGMVLFFHDAQRNVWTHRAYNFYVFPKQVASNSPNVRFTCEASSLEFLAGWGFDFNKLIYKGIPYLTLTAEQKMKDGYDKKQMYLQEENQTPCPVPENLKKFMEKTQAQVRSLVAGEVKELFLEDLSPFQRKLVFNNIKPKYSGLYFETIIREDPASTVAIDPMDSSSVSESDSETPRPSTPRTARTSRPVRVLRVAKMSDEERKIRETEKKRQVFETIDKNIGFSKVIRVISQTGKVVVGHNMILDVAHSVHQFVGELPESLQEFKQVVQAAFPNLVDTKLMCCTHPFRDQFQSSVLGDVLKRVQESPFGLPEMISSDGEKNGLENSNYSMDNPKQHEAGYDAYITGVCFIGLCKYLGKMHSPPKNCVLPESPLVMPFINKLYLMRMLDISYMNISGTDLTPTRDHVFHVTCPKDATTKSIVNLFSPFGQVQVWWTDDTHLFVSLNDKDQASFVMRNLDLDNHTNYRVIPFTQYQITREAKICKRPHHHHHQHNQNQQQKAKSPPLVSSAATVTAAVTKSKKQKKHKKASSQPGSQRQHNSSSTSSTASSSSSDGGTTLPTLVSSSPPLDSVHQKKKPKTEQEAKAAAAAAAAAAASKTDGVQFEEPSTWD